MLRSRVQYDLRPRGWRKFSELPQFLRQVQVYTFNESSDSLFLLKNYLRLSSIFLYSINIVVR
jgi:hypothetical protein